MVMGIAVLVTNLAASVWGAIGWIRKDARASIVFWPLLRVAQATVVIQAVVGLLLVARGDEVRRQDGNPHHHVKFAQRVSFRTM